MAENIKLPTKLVIDASVVLSELIPDEKTSKKSRQFFDDLTDLKITALAPSILKYEIANALRTAVLRKRISRKLSQGLIREFLKLGIKFVEIDFTKALNLAIDRKLSFYDAAYVYLANKEKVKLFSLDKKLMI